MRLISLLTTLMLCLIGTAATAAVDIKAGEYVVFYHHDVLGSPVAATNEQGQVIWYEHNEAFGRSRGRINQSGSPYGDNALEEANARQGYTGHTKDNSAGLTYMKARYYDERIGRFLSNDPVGFSTGSPMMFNRYAYANNNPYKYTDPDGEFAFVAAIPWAYTAIKSALFLGSATAFAYGVTETIKDYNESSDEDEPQDQDAETSDREPGPDGKRGSTGGPGAGRKFKPESPEVKEQKEGVPCRYCGTKTTNTPGLPNSRERDHIDPKSRGGNDFPENEGDSCRTCNRSKGAKNPDEWAPAE